MGKLTGNNITGSVGAAVLKKLKLPPNLRVIHLAWPPSADQNKFLKVTEI